MQQSLKNWEEQTITALANEALDRASANEEIRHPERWIEKAIHDRRVDALNNDPYRSQLQRHAERLGIGNQHPPRVTADDPLGYELASADTVNRWGRITRLVFGLPDDHPWKAVYRDVVTKPVETNRHTAGWDAPDEGMGILDLLEDEAQSQGLIGFEDAEPITVAELLAVLSSKVGPQEKAA